MNGLISALILRITTAVQRVVLTYCLMALGGLILIFAAGYGLDAVHSLLLFRFGPVMASLIVAAALLVLAGVFLAIAFAMRSKPHRQSPVRPPSGPVPFQRPYSLQRVRAVVAGAAGAASAGLAVFGLVRRRRARAQIPRKRSFFSI